MDYEQILDEQIKLHKALSIDPFQVYERMRESSDTFQVIESFIRDIK